MCSPHPTFDNPQPDGNRKGANHFLDHSEAVALREERADKRQTLRAARGTR